jgi:glycosyltransferase involved in cell wall biosynthesis
MSASNAFDARRGGLREAVKKRTVGLFSAALTGGSLSAAYVRALGMPAERVFVGYDVVDNAHFARGAAAARTAKAPTSGLVGSDTPFFLASARFVAKKNLDGLIEAYARYRATVGDGAWRLVIMGDGELRPAVEAQIDKLGLAAAVLLPGYRQYDELPAWYGSASCFVHASTVEQWGLVVNEAMAAGLPVLVSNRCGCAVDLVHDGINGFTFDPHDIDVLAHLMHRVAHGAVDRTAMARSSAAIISDWGPERFATGLAKAVEAAVRSPRRPPSLGDRLLLQALARR